MPWRHFVEVAAIGQGCGTWLKTTALVELGHHSAECEHVLASVSPFNHLRRKPLGKRGQRICIGTGPASLLDNISSPGSDVPLNSHTGKTHS